MRLDQKTRRWPSGDQEGQRFARSLGAVWAGGSDEAPPEPLDDGDLLEVLSDAVDGGTAVYVMTHFDHPREVGESTRRVAATFAAA